MDKAETLSHADFWLAYREGAEHFGVSDVPHIARLQHSPPDGSKHFGLE